MNLNESRCLTFGFREKRECDTFQDWRSHLRVPNAAMQAVREKQKDIETETSSILSSSESNSWHSQWVLDNCFFEKLWCLNGELSQWWFIDFFKKDFHGIFQGSSIRLNLEAPWCCGCHLDLSLHIAAMTASSLMARSLRQIAFGGFIEKCCVKKPVICLVPTNLHRFVNTKNIQLTWCFEIGVFRPNTVVVPGIMPLWYLLLLTAFRSLGSTMEVLMRHAALTMKCSANRCGYGWYIPLFWNIFYFSSSVCFNTYIIISSDFLGFCLTWLGCFSAQIRLLEISLTTFTKDDLQWGIFGTFEMDPTYLQLSICAQSLKPS